MLDALEAEGWLSDERFADAYSRSRMRAGYGPIRIARDLQRRGVDGELIESALTCDGATWEALAAGVKVKKFGADPPATYPDWAKQARFLQARGFTSEQIHQVLGRPPGAD